MSNFQVIERLDEDEACKVLNIFAKDQREAEVYAAEHPERTIYWVRSLHMGIWFNPLRRKVDLRGKVV